MRSSSSGSAGRRRAHRMGGPLVVALLLPTAACSAGAEPAPPPDSGSGLGAVVTYTDLSHEHVQQDVTYPQTPPVGGPHWPPQTQDGYGWLRCGVYDEPVVDEFAVHSLEHGAVWLSYRPGTPPADVARLVELAAIDPAYVLVSPVDGQAQPFAATAWGLQLGVTSSSDPALRTFTGRYAAQGQGGEKGADCAGGTTPTQARAALARVAAAPATS